MPPTMTLLPPSPTPAAAAWPPPTLDWDEPALRAALQPWWPGCTVQAVGRCDSTNTALLARAAAQPLPLPPPCLLVAEQQTHGRGRHGRPWLSRGVGATLAFSLAVPLAPRDWGGLSLAVGLALAAALEPMPGGPGVGHGEPQPPWPRLRLKWPNDLWWLGAAPPADGGAAAAPRKLGGILIETAGSGVITRGADGAAVRWCVVGVGLNIAPQPADGFALTDGYACCRELDPDATAPRVLARVAAALAQALRRFEREGFDAPLRAAWRRRDALHGRAVVLVGAGAGSLHGGHADGVDEDGALRVRADDGTLHRVVAGEVSVRPLPLPPAQAATAAPGAGAG